jgi:hypothetical protein
MNLFYHNDEQFSIHQVSETTSILEKQLNSFQNSIFLSNDEQQDIGLIDSFKFLLSNCQSSYKHFNNILSYFIENPQHYTHDSIGSSTEKIIHSSLSQLYSSIKFIIGKSTIFFENSNLETIINIIGSSISNTIQIISHNFSIFDQTIKMNKFHTIQEFLSLFSNKFNDFIKMFQENCKILFEYELDCGNDYCLYQIAENFFEYLKK